ncbi:ACP S-malonyltransferase [Salinisphaera sp. Q1T1-3]|uniref:ACP S-malonyltransferase n=1 Tax=Salinisphaera sp. Q1T1-3 TaxID=2321229 RepID=UPI000E717D20|nr:ACP S-malonyltransferase [Salinisphaera sp. Q1T1-3]RJS95089.1 [acyl-carrier-protein] S-malonyltransferase [Salinisphaera sp. Q1T1-3]
MSRFAMLFPGQGAQSVGMLADLGAHHPVIGETFAEAGDALGFDLADLVTNGPAETLDQTEYTQPALVAASVAAWRAFEAAGGPRPACVAGHSLGEYSALVMAGSLDFADALRLTRLRGQAMQNAVAPGEGAMAAVIGLADEDVVAACAEVESAHGSVSAANFNAPLQVVIAGHAEAVAQASQIAKAKGAKLVKPLSVSVPSHCALMSPAADRLASHLSDIPLREPTLPVYHNVDARPREDVAGIRRALVAQLAESVQWTDTIRRIRETHCDLFLECGPGKVLSGLNKRIDKSIRSMALSEPDDFEAAIAAVAE